jgi:hypothetical protein
MKLLKNSLRIPAVIAAVSFLLESLSFAVDMVPRFQTEFPHAEDQLKYSGLALLIASLVMAIVKIGEGIDLIEKISKIHLKLDAIARYGANGVALASLLNQDEEGVRRFPHALAGGAALSELIFETYSLATESFVELLQMKEIEVILPEESIINTFLRHLVEKLPIGSVWLGISCLQDRSAWDQKTGEPSFLKFESSLEDKVQCKQLTCFRSFCFESQERLTSMQEEIDKQVNIGINVKAKIVKELPNDLSVIWVPIAGGKRTWKRKMDKKNQSPVDPWTELEMKASGYAPLCGLSFDLRAGRETSRLVILPPAGVAFDDLKQNYQQAWS